MHRLFLFISSMIHNGSLPSLLSNSFHPVSPPFPSPSLPFPLLPSLSPSFFCTFVLSFFLSFLLFCFLITQFQMTGLYFTDSFFGLIRSDVDTLSPRVFIWFIVCFHIFFWVSVRFPVEIMNCFSRFHWTVFLCFLVPQWASLKQLFWIFIEQITHLHFEVVYQRVTVFFGGVMSLIFHVLSSLTLLSSHLKESPPPVSLTGPWERNPFPASLFGILNLSPASLCIFLLHTSCSLPGEILKIECFLSILHSQAECS